MRTANYSELRNNLKAYLDGVINDSEPLLVHRAGNESVVVISLEEYNSIKETEYIMKSPAMMDIIRKGEREIKNGEGKNREYWKRTGNKVIMNKITALLKDIAAHPYTGIGKPEPLKYELAGYWSRRINAEHRIIYSVHDNIVTVYVLSMRYHYVK